MSVPAIYPSNLPCPTATSVQRTERRYLSTLPGPRTSRAFSSDKVSVQPLEFVFRSQSLVQAWLDWYHAALSDGAAWFSADWPQPEGGSGIRRFVGALSYPEFIPPKKMWRVQATCQIRGRGLPPLINSDPFFQDVLLLINGEDSSNFIRDFSPRNAVFSNVGATRDTVDPKYGTACIDCSVGGVQVESAATYCDLLGADEFTLEYWVKIVSVPININNRYMMFGPFGANVEPDSTLYSNVAIIGGSSIGVTSLPGVGEIGVWQHIAFTRTNGGSLDCFLQMYVDGNLQGMSGTFGNADVANSIGFQTIGENNSPATVRFDDIRLTRGINRYRGLASFSPPTQLATR